MIAMDETAARVHNVRYIPLAFVGLWAEQRFLEMTDHDSRVVQVEQQGSKCVAPERTYAVRDHEPSGLGLER
jgi:hypothetical protein